MMAYEIKPPGSPETFTTSPRDERAAGSRRTFRLTNKEVQDLRDLWTGVGLVIGVRSPQGALENRLLLAPPRDLTGPILDELELHGGRCCEGLLLRLVAFDKHGLPRDRGVPSEIRRALKQLVREGKVERRPMPMPDVPPPTRFDEKLGEWVPNRTYAEQRRVDDWTGFEIRLAGARLALRIVPLEREERWRRQDEALEREWHTIQGSETPGTLSYDPPEDARSSGANRALRALAKLSERQAEVLRAIFGQHHDSSESELDAVRALVGGDAEAARAATEDACKAYREARGS